MVALRDAEGRYTGPIVDAHHHLWDVSLGRHPWLAGAAARGDPVLGRDCLPETYLRDTEKHDVVATVHVEAGWDGDDPFGEIAWLDSLQRPYGIAERYVAYAQLGAANAEAVLEWHAQHPRIVGVREILSWHPDPARSFSKDPHRMRDPNWRAGLAALARHGLSFDLMISPWQTDDALELVRAIPDLRFALNHCGSPMDRDADGMSRWRNGLKALATAPNVSLKISDLVAYDWNWTLESLRAVVLTCLDCFGPERAMLASDHPVVALHASFDQTYSAFKTILASCSDTECLALFADNASQFYRLST